MTKNLAKWTSELGQTAEIRALDGCGWNVVPQTVKWRYDCHGFRVYLGNVGSKRGLAELSGQICVTNRSAGVVGCGGQTDRWRRFQC